jgi:hypothetical protein
MYGFFKILSRRKEELKRNRLIALFVSVGLVLALVLSGCAAPEAEVIEKTVEKTVTETVQAPEILQVVNPTGTIIPVEMAPNAPRLDTLDGKTIFYYETEATNMHMPELLRRLKQDYPNTTFVVDHTENFGLRTPTEEHLTFDAAIRGVSW